LLLDEKGAELARFKGNFSSLDSRAAGAQVLVATLDNQTPAGHADQPG